MTKEIHDINTRALDFVAELIDYIAEYPDDDYMTMECLCRKLVKYHLMSKVDGYYTADRKTEPQTTDYCDVCNHKGCDNCVADGSNPYCVPSNYEPKDEPQTDYTPDCPFCKRYGTEDCLGSDCRHYKTYKTEPQTERSE